MEVVKVIIVNCSDSKYWYNNLKGKKFHVYGDINKPHLFGDSIICVENSASIDFNNVIFIK